MDDQTTTTPDPVTSLPPGIPPAPGSIPFEPAAPEGTIPPEPQAAGPDPAPATSRGRRTVTRGTFLAGLAVAAVAGAALAGMVATVADQDMRTAGAGAPWGTYPREQGGQRGQPGGGMDGDHGRGGGNGDQGRGGRIGGPGQRGIQDPSDGRMPFGGHGHGYPDKDGSGSSPDASQPPA